MIIEALLNLVVALIGVLLLPLKLASLPATVITTVEAVIAYFLDGMAIIGAYTHLGYLLSLFSVVILIDTVMLTYKVIMWILRKIPFLNIH